MTRYSHQERLLPEHIDIINKFTAEIPVRVGALAKELNLEVVVAALPLNISGLIQPDGAGSFIIKVNRFESKARQRFTIAHEIAHFLLHRNLIQAGVVDSVLYRSKLSSRLEAEANRLAADIVMPRHKLREFSGLENPTSDAHLTESFAEIFQVSKQAMGIRLGD